MKVTFYGHFCFGVEIEGKNLLFDPFISGNPNAAGKVDIAKIKADYILISHGHQDHIADTETILQNNPQAEVITNVEVANWLTTKGAEKAHGMNIGGHIQLGAITVKYVTAIHSSSLPDGSYGGNPGGFVVSTKERCFYFSGDTALTYDMKLLGEYHELDFAMLPIGDYFTMGVNDAIIAADFIACDQVIAAHFNTFPPIEIDTEDAINKFEQEGVQLIVMGIGETKEM